jgi:hypothetical protein
VCMTREPRDAIEQAGRNEIMFVSNPQSTAAEPEISAPAAAAGAALPTPTRIRQRLANKWRSLIAGRLLLRRRLLSSIGRWGDVLLMALVGAVVFELLLPLAWPIVKTAWLPYSRPFILLATGLAVTFLTFAVAEPIRMSRRQWRRMPWYPSSWLAIPLATGLAAVSERLPSALRPHSTVPDWLDPFAGAFLAITVSIGVLTRQLPWRPARRVASPSTSARTTATTWTDIAAWIAAGERPLASGERDLFQHWGLAARIAENVASDYRNIALLGRFGSGKSSILSLVATELRRRPGTFIVVDFDVWAVPNPEDVPRLALSRVVDALDEYVDTIQFRGLPLAYQRLASAEPTGRLSAILGHESRGDALDLLGGVSRVATTIGARIVLIVQDLERAGKEFDTRHLQRLLWALRAVEGFQFILSVDPDHSPLDFPKLCDSIELVPALDVSHVATILIEAYGHWRTKFNDIDPHPDRRNGDKLRLGHSLTDEMSGYIQRTGKGTPLNALVSLLDTPRSLKHVLRRVDDSWDKLHGEAELDDIVIVSALRHGAEVAYRFILSDIDAARHAPSEMLPRTKEIKAEWETVLKQIPVAAAVQQLVDLMRIEQLTKDSFHVGVDSPQGVHEFEPVDYFRRIVAEELNPSELRDQDVLRSIDEWRNGRRGRMLSRLLHSSDTNDTYARMWEHFSIRHTDAELMELVDELVREIKARDGRSAAADHPALLSLWRRCNRQFRPNEQLIWLKSLIVDAIPVSVYLANGLFYYWTGDSRIVDDVARREIRESVVEKVRVTFSSSSDLAAVLTKEHPYSVLRLVTQTGKDRSLAAFEQWSDYLPDLIIDGARELPDVFMPELANLVADPESGMVAAAGVYPPRFTNQYGIDRARMTALFGSRLDDVLTLLSNYRGDNAYATRATEVARAWIDERLGDEPPADRDATVT